MPEPRDIPREIAYVMEHGESPEAQSARTLMRFMTCKAGVDLVEHGLLRPYGYTLDAGRVFHAYRMLKDDAEYFEMIVAGVAMHLHDECHDQQADELARACEHLRRRIKVAGEMIP